MRSTRVEALIDGVIAIAVTLLVLDLPRPEGSAHLAHDLLRLWPSYAAYVISFATVALFWMEHHAMMSAVRYVTRGLLSLIMLFLLCITVVPWPTGLAAAYATRGGGSAEAAAVLYAATLLCTGLSFSLGWRYLAQHDELVEPAARAALPASARRSFLGSTAYLPAIGLAFVSPTASFALDGAIAIAIALTRSEVPGLIHRAAIGAEEA